MVLSAAGAKGPPAPALTPPPFLFHAVPCCSLLCCAVPCCAVQVGSGGTLSEVEVDLELTGRRRQQQGFIEPSFPTIAGANGNGAIIHYRAQEGTCK